MSRLEFYENIFSAKALFAAGLLIMPALLFIPSTGYRCFQFVFLCFLALLSGKKINFMIMIPIIMFIIVFNLIIPYGRVLFSLGVFKITSGALKAGVHRAFTLQSFVMLSTLAIRRDLKIAVHDYKYFFDKQEQYPIQPDYWCRRHDVSTNDDTYWIHYMSHELMGLTEKELEENYYSHDPSLKDALHIITEKK